MLKLVLSEEERDELSDWQYGSLMFFTNCAICGSMNAQNMFILRCV